MGNHHRIYLFTKKKRYSKTLQLLRGLSFFMVQDKSEIYLFLVVNPLEWLLVAGQRGQPSKLKVLHSIRTSWCSNWHCCMLWWQRLHLTCKQNIQQFIRITGAWLVLSYVDTTSSCWDDLSVIFIPITDKLLVNFCFSVGPELCWWDFENRYLTILQEALTRCKDPAVKGAHVKCKVWCEIKSVYSKFWLRFNLKL